MVNGVNSFWAIFFLTAILFGFQNCSPSDVATNELVYNASLTSVSQTDDFSDSDGVSDTGYYGGQNFKLTESENGQILEELLVTKTHNKTISLSVKEKTFNCDFEKDKLGLEALDALIKFSGLVRVTHPSMFTGSKDTCSNVDASIKRQHIEIGDVSKTFLITKDSTNDCLMDDPYELSKNGHRVFIISNLSHSEILDIVEEAERASELSKACENI